MSEQMESSRSVRQAEKYISRAVYNMGIAPSIADDEMRHEVYKTVLRYLSLAIEAMRQESGEMVAMFALSSQILYVVRLAITAMA